MIEQHLQKGYIIYDDYTSQILTDYNPLENYLVWSTDIGCVLCGGVEFDENVDEMPYLFKTKKEAIEARSFIKKIFKEEGETLSLKTLKIVITREIIEKINIRKI